MIFHDTKRDYFVVRIEYKDEMGVSHRKSKIAHTLKEAKKLESTLRLEMNSTSVSTNELTIDDLWQEYSAYSRSRTKRTSYESYETKYRKYIKGAFGERPASVLKPSDFKQWKDRLPKDLSFNSKRHIYTVLHMILAYAYKTRGLNALRALEMEGDFKLDPNFALMQKETPLQYWTPVQFSIFAHALRKKAEAYQPCNHDYMVYWSTYVIINILFYTGLRRGEANALFVEDFHEGEQPYLDINKSVTHKVKGGGWFLTGPKNKTSVRKVPCPRVLVDILREHISRLAKFPEGLKPDMYLVGGLAPLNDSSADRIKEDTESELGLPHIRVHDLRHSYVSVLINAGTPIATISKLVGHSSTEMTWKVYSHMYPQTLSTAVNVFDTLDMSEEKSVKKGSQKGSQK